MAKLFELQSSNYEEIQATATADIPAGSHVVLGSTNVFTMVDVLNGERYTGIKKAEKVLAPKAAVAIAPGEPAYLDTGNSVVTNVATDNTLVGFFQEAAEAGDSKVHLVFDGTAEFLKA